MKWCEQFPFLFKSLANTPILDTPISYYSTYNQTTIKFWKCSLCAVSLFHSHCHPPTSVLLTPVRWSNSRRPREGAQRKSWKRKCFTHWEVTSLVGTERALWSLREEWSNRYVEGKVERDLHKGLVAASTPQPKTLFCLPAGTSWGWVLRFGLQRSQRGLGLAAWRQLERMRIYYGTTGGI